MKRWVLAATLLASLAQAQELTMTGVSDADVKRLKKELPRAFESEPNLETIDDIIRFLTALGTYEQVLAETTSSGRIQISARPLRTIRQVLIFGEDEFSERQLRPVISLEVGSRFDRKRMVDAGERLKRYYADRGFLNTVIELTFGKATDTSVSVTFTIRENNPCMIDLVDVVTENKELSDRLKTLTRKVRRKPLTLDRVTELREKIEKFLQNHRYLKSELLGPDVKYNSDKTVADLSFRLTQPYGYEFIPQGHHYFSESEIYREMSPDTIERGTADPAVEAVDRIRLSYLNLGFPNVEVRSQTKEIPESFIRRVLISITEGHRVKIKEFRISGRISRPSRYYERFIRYNSSDLIRKGYYNRQDLERAYENLTNNLRNQGFLRAKIQSARLEYLEKPDEARVVIVMDEGPLTQLSTITFNGAKSFSSPTLAETVSLKANSPLHLEALEASLAELTLFYKSHGFLEFKILNEGEDLIEYNEKGTQANVRFDIYEGPRVIVASVEAEGNTFTHSDVILRSVEIEPGDVLTPEKIENSEVHLNRLGIFGRVAIHTREDGTNISQRHVVVSVSERDPGVFRLGTGVSSERKLTLRGFLGLSYNNLWGTGRALSGRAEVKSHVVEVNYPQYEIVAGYLEPFLFNSRSRGRVNLTRSERVFQFDSTSGQTNIYVSNKVDFFVERDINRHWRFNWKAYSLESRKEFERYGRCIPADDTTKFDPNKYCDADIQQIATMGPLLDIDYRNDSFLPTRGHYSTWNLDYSSPTFGSSGDIEKAAIHFVRTEASHSHYFPVRQKGDIVYAVNFRTGYVGALGGNGGVPASQAFFLGGLSTLRGFGGSSVNERIPPGFEVAVNKSTQILFKTDSHYFLVKNELAFPISGDHGGVVFYDGGMVKISGYNISRPYRDAVGIGYRYKTPVGPFSVDLAFKINPRIEEGKKESPFQVHFYFGTF